MTTSPLPDYYKMLGVPETAKKDEIERAFRRLSKECHPDRTGGDPVLTERFKELSEAAEILTNAEKRKTYDDKRRMVYGGGQSGTRERRDVSDLFRVPGITIPGGFRVDPISAEPQDDPAVLMRLAFQAGERIFGDGEGHIHDKDMVMVGGKLPRTYTFRRVKHFRSGDTKTYLSTRPMLCVSNRVFSNVSLAPGQDLATATPNDCRDLMVDFERINGEFVTLVSLRKKAAQIAAELVGMLEANDTLATAERTYKVMKLQFKKGIERFEQEVMCTGMMILSAVDGEPEALGYSYATQPVAKRFAIVYQELWDIAANKARMRGKRVSQFSLQRLKNMGRSGAARIL